MYVPPVVIIAVLISVSTVFGQETTPSDLGDLRKAAEAGNAYKQVVLGTKYYLGTGGIPKDQDEGTKWLRKAASQGNAELQKEVAFIFSIGGDPKEAAYWYMKSAAQRNFLATTSLLTYCLEGGTLTAKDL